MVSGERHHAAGDGEVVVLPGQAAIDFIGWPHLHLQGFQLGIGALTGRSLGQADLPGDQLGVKPFDQVIAPHRINQNHAIADGPPFGRHSIAMMSDM